jgi:hypothetical protein
LEHKYACDPLDLVIFPESVLHYQITEHATLPIIISALDTGVVQLKAKGEDPDF